ncbi:hypothetical protein P4679_22230 [Priestia megaterium]|uniref:hypothetical protein n=1 Tax=Priestia megaterium TaxID=1404 RepID=UPI002E2431F7|nr:hypothetical protein [Priestia megaterium]
MIDPDFAVDPISKNIRIMENNGGESTSYVVYWVQYSNVLAYINEVENNEGITIYVGSFNGASSGYLRGDKEAAIGWCANILKEYIQATFGDYSLAEEC